MEYICDSLKGEAANATYLALAKHWTPPPILRTRTPMAMACQTDGRFSTAGGWVTPSRVETTGASTRSGLTDADWDADGDGLPNLCEYQWSVVRTMGLNGDLLEDYGETPEAVEAWAVADPKPRRLRWRYPTRWLGVEGSVFLGPFTPRREPPQRFGRL